MPITAARTFRPDAEWQQLELERLYLATDGTLTFLGDWHVRNAHEHDDEDGRFENGYGYSHRWTVGSAADPYNVNSGGVTI